MVAMIEAFGVDIKLNILPIVLLRLVNGQYLDILSLECGRHEYAEFVK